MHKLFENLSINTVYHCTSSSALLAILQSNKLLGNDTYGEGRKYVCFTVDPNYKVDHNAIFRMKFNANLLSMKYKLVRYKDPEMPELDESEYRVYANSIPNIKALVDEIEILEIPKRTKQVEELYQYLKENNLPLGYNLQQQVNVKGDAAMNAEFMEKIKELMHNSGLNKVSIVGNKVIAKLGQTKYTVTYDMGEGQLIHELTDVPMNIRHDIIKIGFIESRKGIFTRYTPSTATMPIIRVSRALAAMDLDEPQEQEVKEQPQSQPKQEKPQVAVNNQVGAAQPVPKPKFKLLDQPKIVKEKYGEGFSILINGVEYRYSSDNHTAQEILDQVEKLAKRSEGKALQWLKANTVNYYGGKDKRYLTTDQASRGAATPVKGAASKGGRAKLVGHLIKSSKKKELKSYTAKGGYATFGFVEPGVELEVVKARDDGYLVVNVKGVAGIKQLQTKMPREVLWEPSNDDVKIEVSQQGQAMPPAEKDPAPQMNKDWEAQLKRIEKFADTQVKELDKDPNWTFKYIDESQEMQELKMPVPGLLLLTGFINQSNQELNQNPVVKKFNNSKTLKRFRNWFNTTYQGMPAKGIIYIDAQVARTKAISALKEAFDNIEFYDGDVVEVNENFYVFDLQDDKVVLINEQERIVIDLN